MNATVRRLASCRFVVSLGDGERSSEVAELTGQRTSIGAAESQLLPSKELVRRDPRLSQNRTEGALREIAGVVGNRGVLVRARVVPDLVAPSGLTVEVESESFETLGDFAECEAGQPAHQAPTMRG